MNKKRQGFILVCVFMANKSAMTTFWRTKRRIYYTKSWSQSYI